MPFDFWHDTLSETSRTVNMVVNIHHSYKIGSISDPIFYLFCIKCKNQMTDTTFQLSEDVVHSLAICDGSLREQ